MNETERRLSGDVAHYLELARANYFTVWVLYAVSIGASIAATILAATKTDSTSLLAVLTAIPGIILLITSTFKFNARSQWHYEKKRRLDALLRLSLAKAQATSEAEVAEKWNRIDEEMDKSWPGWGELSKTAQKTAD
jgi:hypothetical protein